MAGRRRTAAVACLVVLVAACGGEQTSPSPARETRHRAAPAGTTATTSAASTTSSPAPPSVPPTPPPAPPATLSAPVRVVAVVDGDTIKVATGETLRLIGVDTPETVDPRAPVQCFGREASARAHALLDGATVRLEHDPTQGRFDRYGRTLAYVWMSDGRLYNEVIIAEGYAHEYTYAIPYRYRERFRVAEGAARDAGRGLWAPTTCAGDTSRPAGALPPTPGGGPACDPSYLGVCIPPPPPDLDCADVPHRRFSVVGGDPHRFDGDRDGTGCE